MKKSLLLCAAFLAVSASVASAAGLNLSWDNCGAAGTENKIFACANNSLSAKIHGSYIAPGGSTAITGSEMVLDLQSASGVLPAWWQFKNAGSCRAASLSLALNTPPAACVNDYWAGQATGSIAAYNLNVVPGATNRARLILVGAVDQTTATPIDVDLEYYSFTLTINGAKTTGAGACAGCTDPVCIVLNEIKLTQPVGVGDYRIQNPADRNYVSWQGGAVGSGGCPAATPARNATWGQVKSLYR